MVVGAARSRRRDDEAVARVEDSDDLGGVEHGARADLGPSVPPVGHDPPLSKDELAFVLRRNWRHLGQELSDDDFTETHAIATIARLSSANFRPLQRLLVQVDRVLRINEPSVVAAEVAEAAASALVIGHVT